MDGFCHFSKKIDVFSNIFLIEILIEAVRFRTAFIFVGEYFGLLVELGTPRYLALMRVHGKMSVAMFNFFN